MSNAFSAKALAQGWIEAWQRQDYAWLKKQLSDNFFHTSPFGTLAGREHYLSVVIPLASKSVQKLSIEKVIEDGDDAAIWFVNHTANGEIASCDWLTTSNGQIISVQSFYDTAPLRGVLSDDDQASLTDH